MSRQSTPIGHTPPPTILARILRGAGIVLPTAARLLLGFLLTFGGWTWIHRADPAGYLSEAVSGMVDQGRPVGIYEPFLRSVVLPHAGVFAFLVGWGELLSGLSLLLGAASRLGAAVAAFQVINYGLMGGTTSLFLHGLFALVLATTVYSRSGRRFGVDRWLYRQWPDARIW